MSLSEKNDGIGTEAAKAPSEWMVTTPSDGSDDGVVGEGADGGDIGLPMDAVAQSGMSPRARALRRGLNSSPAYMFAALIVIFAVFTALSPHAFASKANVQNVITDASVLLVMAVGMTYVMVAAGFDLSIGSVLVFSGVMATKVMGWVGGQSYATVLAGLVTALLSGLAWGLFNGWCVTRLRVPALITTLGTLGAALGVANLITGGNDIATLPKPIGDLSNMSWFGFPPIFWLAVVVVLIGGAVLRYTRFGRHTYIVGSNDEAARRAGINVSAHLLKLYALSGSMAGLGGMMSLVRFTSTTIGGHNDDALNVITGVILGGTSLYGGAGTILGTVIGIFIPALLQDGFVIRSLQAYWQQVATGFILIIAVYIDQLKRKSRDRA